MGGFFNAESFIWKPFGYFADVLILSLLWLLCSLPVITLGAATTALYDSVAHGFRYGEKQVYGRFFRTFKTEFLGSIPSTLLWLLVVGGCYWLLRRFIGTAGGADLSVVAAMAGLVLLTVISGIGCWVFPVLSRFTFGFVGLNLTALKLSIALLPSTLLMSVSLWFCIGVCVRYLVPVFVLPALLILFWSLFTERVFKKYMPGQDNKEN